MVNTVEQHDVVSVVGGGWSVTKVDLNKLPGTIIAVNDGMIKVPRVDFGITMDRLWTENRWEALHELQLDFFVRRSATKNIITRGLSWCNIFECDNKSVKFSATPDRLNGSNSGTCALNLAHIMRPKLLLLFGLDMCRGPEGQPYWYDPYPWAPQGATKPGSYKEWVAEFDSIARQFREIGTVVRNVTTRSMIEVFQRVTPNELGIGRNE